MENTDIPQFRTYRGKIELEGVVIQVDIFVDNEMLEDRNSFLISFLCKSNTIYEMICRNISKSKEYYVFVLPVDKEVDLKKAAHVVGEKSLAMVHVKDIQAVTGYIRGGCTSIGMKKKYRTVIHESAREWDTVIVSGGRLGSQILLSPDDLVKAVDGEMADIVFCENK